MGNTADLAMVQKTNFDTFHKEGKSQRVITERGGCSRSAVSKHFNLKFNLIFDLNAKLTGRNKLGRKMCTSNRDDRKLENAVKQS